MTDRLIAFDGPDGCGKSTTLRLVADRLRAAGLDVVTTREPGGCPGAEDIRRLLVDGVPGRWTPTAELLLHAAARAEHVAAVVRPAISLILRVPPEIAAAPPFNVRAVDASGTPDEVADAVMAVIREFLP